MSYYTIGVLLPSCGCWPHSVSVCWLSPSDLSQQPSLEQSFVVSVSEKKNKSFHHMIILPVHVVYALTISVESPLVSVSG